jgi:hypothetical protein
VKTNGMTYTSDYGKNEIFVYVNNKSFLDWEIGNGFTK